MAEIYRRFAALLPTRIINVFKQELEYVGIEMDERRFVGFVFVFSLATGFATTLLLSGLLRFPLLFTIAGFFIAFGVYFGAVFLWLDSIAESKGKYTEKILPDALQLIASNIKAGLTTERALFISARPEFGPLSEELKKTSKKILAGARIEFALMELPQKIKSKVLERTIWLICQGIKSGGQIANLLVQLSSDIREENATRSEIRANISMYVGLIFLVTAIGAPVLLGVTSYIVGVLSEQTAKISIPEEKLGELVTRVPAAAVIGIPQASIQEDFILLFTSIVLLVTCVFAGLTLGAINTGSEKNGIKFIPILLIISFVVFHVVRWVMVNVLGKMFVIM